MLGRPFAEFQAVQRFHAVSSGCDHAFDLVVFAFGEGQGQGVGLGAGLAGGGAHGAGVVVQGDAIQQALHLFGG